ncbi:hypothetical protein ACTPDI_00670 [Clostridioides difficile]
MYNEFIDKEIRFAIDECVNSMNLDYMKEADLFFKKYKLEQFKFAVGFKDYIF